VRDLLHGEGQNGESEVEDDHSDADDSLSTSTEALEKLRDSLVTAFRGQLQTHKRQLIAEMRAELHQQRRADGETAEVSLEADDY